MSTEYEIEVCNRNDGTHTAWQVSSSIYRNKNKIPLKRAEFVQYMDMTYLMGATNTARDIYNYFKANPEPDFDVLMGELELIILKSWNNMLKNPIGQATFKKLELEDILDGKNIKHFIKNKTP